MKNLKNTEFLLRKLAERSPPDLLLEILQDYYLTPRSSLDDWGQRYSNTTPLSSLDDWRQRYSNTVMEENFVQDLIKSKIAIDEKHARYCSHLTKLVTARQDLVQSTLATLETLRINTDEQTKQDLLLKLHKENDLKLDISLDLFSSASKIFGADEEVEVPFGSPKMPLYPRMITMKEKYQALCKAFDGGMDPDNLVRFTYDQFCAAQWAGASLKYYHEHCLEVPPPSTSSESQIEEISKRVSRIVKENTSLQEESILVHAEQIDLLAKDLEFELIQSVSPLVEECITQIDCNLTQLEERLAKKYIYITLEKQCLDVKIDQHAKLAELIESAKNGIALKSRGAKTKNSYEQSEVDLLKIGLDVKIAEHASLGDSIESEKMHLHDITLALKELINIEASLTNDTEDS
jgi:hypothetical protein